jgi:hypothetical protein
MKKFVSLFLVFSLVVLSGNLYAKKKGAEIMVQKKDGQQVRGELITVKENLLLLLETKGADVSVDIGDVRKITIVRKSKAGKGAIYGAILGAFFTTILIVEDQSQPVSFDFGVYLGASAVFIGGGSLLGALFGLDSGRDETIQIQGKYDSEIKEILEKLRKKARIRNYK